MPGDRTNAVIEETHGDIKPDEFSNSRRAGLLPLAWQAIGEPIYLAGHVIEDLREAQAFEPRRGPGAEISLRVIAVDNDRLVLLERSRGLAVEPWQWDVDRPGQVYCFILLHRQDLNQPCPICQPMTYLITLDLHGHTAPPSS